LVIGVEWVRANEAIERVSISYWPARLRVAVGIYSHFAINGDLLDEPVCVDSRELSGSDEEESRLGEHFS